MPASYTIHAELGVVATRYWGDVTDDEFVALYRTLYADPTYRHGLNELADLLAVERFEFSAGAMREVAHMAVRAYRNRLENFRTAILVRRDALYGIGRMYEVFSERSPETAKVFRDADAAMRWVGIEPRPLAELHASPATS